MDVIKYHNTNPNSRIHVSAEMKNRRYRVVYITTFTRDERGTWGAIIPFGFKHFTIEPQKTEQEAIKVALAMPCAAEYTRDVPAEISEVAKSLYDSERELEEMELRYNNEF